MIELSHVSKSFGTKKAVDDLSARIPSGAITGFIGPNGAGKTTTIHMMTGVLAPDQGVITLNGENIVEQPLQAKKQFVIVPDSPDIFLRLSGREYIRFMSQIYQVPVEEAASRMEALAVEFGLSDALDQQMESYSHGMRQKAIVIAALTCDPDVWILDEPMTGLDPASSYLLKEKMRQHAARGKTVFFSTHVLEVAEKLCDKILMIDAGKIVFDGTLDQLRNEHPDRTLEEIFMEVTSHV